MKKLILVFFVLIGVSAFAGEIPTYSTKQYRVEHGLGLTRSPNLKAFLKALPKHAEFRDDSSVPGKWDLTDKVSPPEDQGSCGSCWDFSLTKALRSALMLAGKDPGVLAFNYLLNNCGPGPHMYGCGGGDFDAGQSFLNGSGPWLDSEDHYTQSEGRCKTGLAVAGTALEMVQVGSDNPSFQELAKANYGGGNGHMLSIDVAVAGSWGSYSGGIYNGNGSGINHMIDLVGYDCESSVDADGKCKFNSQGEPANGDGYLKVENNWGSWGENGYMRTRAHRNQIASTAVYFRVKELPPPPVDGGWSAFGPWSDCVNGQQSHTRTCTNPAPSNGGKACVGTAVEVQSCQSPGPTPTPGSFPWVTVLIALVAFLAGALVFAFIKK